MPKIADVIKDILEEDTHHIFRGSMKCVEGVVGIYSFGTKSLLDLMGLNFECNGCGSCCADESGVCGDYSEKRCIGYEKRPLLCKTYPFAMVASPVEINGRKILFNGRTVEEMTDGKHIAYRFNFLTGLNLVIEDTCEGWLTGEKTVRELGVGAVNEIRNWSGPLLPRYAKNREEDEQYAQAVLGGLKRAFSTPGADTERIFWDAYETELTAAAMLEVISATRKRRPPAEEQAGLKYVPTMIIKQGVTPRTPKTREERRREFLKQGAVFEGIDGKAFFSAARATEEQLRGSKKQKDGND